MIVWLASYPRSGNTFLRIMLYHAFGLKTCSLYGDLADIAAHRSTSEIVGHTALPSGWTADEARKDDGLWLVKTHDWPQGEDKAIYVIRDGRETLVSYFNYLQHYADYAPSLLSVVAGAVAFGPWSDHVEAWDPLQRSDTLLLRFEDVVKHPQEYLPLLARFLEVTPISRSTPDFAELHATDPNFFRSGRTDSWKTVFTEDAHNLFWLLHGDAMTKHGYTNDVPALFRAQRSTPREGPASEQRQRFEALSSLTQRALKEHSAEHRRQLSRQEQQLKRLHARSTSLDLEIDRIRSSMSWRATKPFRVITRLLAHRRR
ncbi:MAG TPA: sulfotransferase domain-containing protein [Anaerolineae bacterium]|nr:sulfotransferase domain-containing protein [Anaerolineae bacterium]